MIKSLADATALHAHIIDKLEHADLQPDGDDRRYGEDPCWRDLLLFHEYFHGDTGRGVGASHQTGWTALVANLLADAARQRLPG